MPYLSHLNASANTEVGKEKLLKQDNDVRRTLFATQPTVFLVCHKGIIRERITIRAMEGTVAPTSCVPSAAIFAREDPEKTEPLLVLLHAIIKADQKEVRTKSEVPRQKIHGFSYIRLESRSLSMEMPTKPETKCLRVLVVEDHEEYREQICKLLRSQSGFEVICEAANGLEGVRRAEELQPDIVVLDVSMPVFGGIEAAARIRRVASKARIVFLSQHKLERIAQAALASGGHAYVVKSAASADLVPAITAAVSGEQFISQLD